MARTESKMMELGTKAPSFSILNTATGMPASLDALKSEKGTVIMFICNHCPYVIHLFRSLVDVANDYQAKGIKFIAISSNDVKNYPDDSPDKMAIVSKVLKLPFPYLYDESQEVAKAYDAACTPDLYLFDGSMSLVYRGRYDGSSPGNDTPVNGVELRAAMDAVLEGQKPSGDQYPSIGCGIKWK